MRQNDMFCRSQVMILACLVAVAQTLAATNTIRETVRPQNGSVGINVKLESGWPIVAGVLDGSPAQRAGLQGGDRIVGINGQSTEGMKPGDAFSLLVGPLGEKVNLNLERGVRGSGRLFQVTLERERMDPRLRSEPKRSIRKLDWSKHSATRNTAPVQWAGNRIRSRVLPYTDFVSLFIRLPIAHATATGRGIRVAVLSEHEDEACVTAIENVAPEAAVVWISSAATGATREDLPRKVVLSDSRVLLIPDPGLLPAEVLSGLCHSVAAKGILVVVPSDAIDDAGAAAQVEALHATGALTVGRADRQSIIGGFNRRFREIQTDVYSTVGVDAGAPKWIAAATAAGVAALAAEKYPDNSPLELRARLVNGARAVWQMGLREGFSGELPFEVDPVSTQYRPRDEKKVVRFRALDAAGALDVDTEVPWFLNMMNCPAAWSVTRGKGVTAVVTDQGFHLRHPGLVSNVFEPRSFGPHRFSDAEQNFHGTDMARILLAVAPEARIIPVLCSGKSSDAAGDLADNIAKSFRYAQAAKAHVVSASWAGWFNRNTNILSAVRETVDGGIVVSWFHFPVKYPGVIRSTFTYAGGFHQEDRLGFADRFFIDPPGFHPVEIEAGLSPTAPQAAGLAVLVKSVNQALTPKEVEEILFQTATNLGDGILMPDALAAVIEARKRASN